MNGTSFTTNRDQFMAELGLRSPLVTGCVLSPIVGVTHTGAQKDASRHDLLALQGPGGCWCSFRPRREQGQRGLDQLDRDAVDVAQPTKRARRAPLRTPR